MPNRWLVKEEPTHYSFDKLLADGKTVWEGIKNPLAQQHLRAMKKGDPILYYHTGKEKAVVGIARAASDAFLDPKKKDGKTAAVEIEAVRRLAAPVPLSVIKTRPRLRKSPLVRISRLSVMPVTEEEWKEIEALARK